MKKPVTKKWKTCDPEMKNMWSRNGKTCDQEIKKLWLRNEKLVIKKWRKKPVLKKCQNLWSRMAKARGNFFSSSLHPGSELALMYAEHCSSWQKESWLYDVKTNSVECKKV